jgi:predicted metal-dependent hydrolase
LAKIIKNDIFLLKKEKKEGIIECKRKMGRCHMVQSRYILRGGERLSYFFEEKKVKNINLRVCRDGSVYVSAPPHTPSKKISDLVAANAERIRAAQAKIRKLRNEIELDKAKRKTKTEIIIQTSVEQTEQENKEEE